MATTKAFELGDLGTELVVNADGTVSSLNVDTDSVSEGSTNLYFTNARARGAISVTGNLTYNSSTGELGFTMPTTIASLSNHDTDDLTEGAANLYFTSARARASLTGGTGITYSSSTGQVELTASGVTADSYGGSTAIPIITVDTYGRITSASTAAVAGVDGVSYNTSTGAFTVETATGTDYSANITLAPFDTGDLAEGSTNLYFTNARANSAITKATIDALNVNADTLDSLNSTQFLRSDTSDTATGTITFNGIRMNRVYYDTNGSIDLEATDPAVTSLSVKGRFRDNTDQSTWQGSKIEFVRNGNWISSMRFYTAPIYDYRDGLERMRIGSNGDIDFYDSTGSNAKFHWDAADERLGIGTTSPSGKLDIDATGADASGDGIIIQNATSGDSSAGLYIKRGSTTATAIYTNPAFSNLNTTFASDGSINFRTNNGNRMELDSTGRLGINRTPSITNSKLEVGGADNVPLINVEASGYTGGIGIGSTGLQLFHGSSSKVTINSSGNVGIGVSPGTKLDVSGQIRTSSYYTIANVSGRIQGSGGAENYLGFHDGTNFVLNAHTSGTYSGRVGIGTTTPVGKLEVESALDNAIYFTGGSSSIRILNYNVSGDNWIQSGTSTNTSQAKLYISGMNGTNITSVFDTANQRVGIGTASPSGKLHVSSGSSGVSSYGVSQDDLIVESGGNAGITLAGPAGASNGLYFATPTTSQRGWIQYDNSNDYMWFGAAIGERLRLNSSGAIVTGTMQSSSILVGNSGSYRIRIGTDGGGATSTVGHTSTYNDGIFWHDANDEYGIYRTSGAWTGPNYQQLKLEWATGIILNGGSSYGQSGVKVEGQLKNHGNIRLYTTNADGNEQRAIFNVGGAGDPFSITGYKADATTIGMKLDSGGTSYFNGGNVGINTTNPDGRLQISNSFGINSVSPQEGLVVTGSYGGGITISDTKKSGLYTITNGIMMHVYVGHTDGTDTPDDNTVVGFINDGTTQGVNFYYDGRTAGVKGSIRTSSSGTTYNTTSDRRLKDNITTITDGKEKLLAMNPVTHTWKADPDAPAVHGFVAQEMLEVIPEAVSGDPDSDEMMSMDYGRITPVIVAALQDALKEIEELKTRINELEAK
jgi:hypothetical protein